MPTYEYQCEKCGLLFEEYQSISAAPLTQCKKTGCGGTVKRLISLGGGFIFKGSGFYSTDYRSDSYKKQAKADGAPAAVPGGTAGGSAGDAKTPKSGPTPPASPTAPAKS
jgi:putative FmdB family regulatory protein